MNPIWRTHIFQVGWFNHQLENHVVKYVAESFKICFPEVILFDGGIESNPVGMGWKNGWIHLGYFFMSTDSPDAWTMSSSRCTRFRQSM